MSKESHRISFGDFKVSGETRKHIAEVLDNNYISGGPKVREFETVWGNLFGYRHNIAVSNGTCADIASCLALYEFGAERGDEIIAPACAFAAVGNSIMAAGFKPVFVDIDRRTMNINPSLIEPKITDRTRAIMAVHTMGKPCDMRALERIAKKHDLKVIEDCCEAHGAKYHGKFVGNLGDAAAFSFYVAHVISCCDGGIVSTNDDLIAYAVESTKFHGRRPGSLYFDHQRHGLNFRMNALTACVGLPELKNFQAIFDKRKKNLIYLMEGTKDLEDRVLLVKEEPHEVMSPHAFSMTLKDPDYNFKEFYDYLEANSIMCKRNFGSMPTQHAAFGYLGHKLGEFPEAEYMGDNGLHFGVHQYLGKNDLDYALEVVHNYFRRFK